MDNGINDMAQVLNVTATYAELSVKLTKESINAVKNLIMLIIHAVQYGQEKGIENAKGKVNLNKMNKLTKNPGYVKISKDKDCRKAFLKFCKQHGVPVTEVKGIRESNVTHWIYPKEYASMMESVMELMQEYATKKFQKDGLSKDEAEQKAKDENRTESAEEACEDLGCNIPHLEFKQKFLETLATPEEKAYYADLDKKRPQITENKKKEIEQAVKKNENREKSNKFEQDGMYSVSFKNEQIIGTVERNNEKFIKVRFENDYSQAFLVNQKYVVKNGDKLYGAFDKNGDITIYNLKDRSEKTMKFKDFISGNSQSKSEEKTRERTKTKSSQTQITSTMPAAPKSRNNRNNTKGKR